MGKVSSNSNQTEKPIYKHELVPSTELGKMRKERYVRSFEIAVDQVTGMSKWLTGSLFAANSGGVLTVLNTADKLTNPELCASLFSAGLVFALLGGTALQEVYNRLSEPLADLIEYWSEVEAGAPEDDDRHSEIAGRMNAIKRWFWTAPIPGWISGILFISASFSVAYGLA